MGKRVGILLMRHLLEAVRQRKVEIADSEPHWLTSEQYRELDDGRIEFRPTSAPDLTTYAREQSFRPVGMVVLDDQDGCRTFVDECALPKDDHEFALRIFHTHAYFWFIHVTSLGENRERS